MVQIVGEETLDCKDQDWEGPDGTDPLHFMFDTEDAAEIAGAIRDLARGAQQIVKFERRIQEVAAPVNIWGDLHGQFRDMLLLFHDFGFPHAKGDNVIFNGDWVDRGKHQLEVVCLVFALKIAFPTKVFLNRGNHEDADMNEDYGFKDQCVDRLPDANGYGAWTAFTDAFTYLPLGCRIG